MFILRKLVISQSIRTFIILLSSEYPAFLIRVASAAESKVTIAENNYAYLFETGLNLNVFQNKIGDTSVGFTSNDVDLYDTTDPATFNKSTGTFIPKEGYTQYGAQR